MQSHGLTDAKQDEKQIGLPLLIKDLLTLKQLINYLPEKALIAEINKLRGLHDFFLDEVTAANDAHHGPSARTQLFIDNTNFSKMCVQLNASIMSNDSLSNLFKQRFSQAMENFFRSLSQESNSKNYRMILLQVIDEEMARQFQGFVGDSEKKNDVEPCRPLLAYAVKYSPGMFKGSWRNKGLLDTLSVELKPAIEENNFLRCFQILIQALMNYLYEKNIFADKTIYWEDIRESKKDKSFTINNLTNCFEQLISQTDDINTLVNLHFILVSHYLAKIAELQKQLSCNNDFLTVTSDTLAYSIDEARSIMANMGMLLIYINRINNALQPHFRLDADSKPAALVGLMSDVLAGELATLGQSLQRMSPAKKISPLLDEVNEMVQLHTNDLSEQRRSQHTPSPS